MARRVFPLHGKRIAAKTIVGSGEKPDRRQSAVGFIRFFGLRLVSKKTTTRRTALAQDEINP